MAKVFLNSGESFTLANSAEVYGAAGTGTEKVLLTGAATAITTDQNIERVELSGNISAYTFQVVGNQVKVYAGTTLVTTIGVQGDADGTKVAFGDGSADLKITGLNQATLGGQALSSTAAAAVTGATLNATDKSATAGSTGTTTPGVGQAFTLTANSTADVPQLTTGNDTITGAAGTFGSSDVLADPSSTDNDTLNAVLTSSLTTAPTVSNVENINLDFKGFGLTYNAASTSNGTITVSSTQDGNSSATLNNVGSTTKIAIGSGISTLNVASSGSTLILNGGQSVTFNNSATSGSFALVSNGSSANTLTYDAAAGSKALTVSGSQSLTIKTADLSDFTGNTVTKSLTGAAKLNWESVITAGASAELSKVAADSFNLNAAVTHNLTFSASNGNVTLSQDIAASTLGVTTDSSSDVLNLNIAVSQANTTGLTITNFETVNLTNTASTPLTIAALTASAASNANTVNLLGTQDITISAFTAGTNGTTLNASNLGAKLVATLHTTALTVGSTIVGGAGNDTITGASGTAGDALVGGAGNDTLNAGGTAAGTVQDTIVGGAGNDVIYLASTTTDAVIVGASASINGGTGVDTLDFTTTSATTLTGKVIDVENVTVRATAGTIAWTTTDSDLSAGSTLVFNVVGGASTDAVTFNGSAEKDASFNITIANSAVGAAAATQGVNSITGGALNDLITISNTTTSADTITGGKGVDLITVVTTAGNDTFVFAAGDSGTTVATADIINGANASDVLKFNSVSTTTISSGIATSSQLGTGWSVENATSGLATKTNATLDDFITAATAAGKAGATGMSGQAVVFVSGADSYVFYAGTDTTSNADDGLVKLIGHTAGFATLTASGFALA